MNYNEEGEIDFISWCCIATSILLVIGFFCLLIWAADAEKKARREMVSPSYAKKWFVENKS